MQQTLDAPDSAMDVVVSFVLYQTPADEILRAIDQVSRSSVAAHIVLVDNGGFPEELSDLNHTKVSLVRSGENLGYGKAHNLAMSLTKNWAPYHIVMNTDVMFEPDVLPTLLRFMEENKQVGLAMPKVFYPDGRVQHLCRLLPHPLDFFVRAFFGKTNWAARRNNRYESHWWDYDNVASFPFLSGCFMVLRRAVLNEVGGFDPRFFMYGEDVDLSRRFHEVSETIFVPHARVVHEYRTAASFKLRRFLFQIVNSGRYFSKWGWFFDRDRCKINKRTVERLKMSGVNESILIPKPAQGRSPC